MCRYLTVYSSTVQVEYSRDMLHKHTNNLSGTVLLCTQYTPVLYKQNTLEICYTNIQTICQVQVYYVHSTLLYLPCCLLLIIFD